MRKSLMTESEHFKQFCDGKANRCCILLVQPQQWEESEEGRNLLYWCVWHNGAFISVSIMRQNNVVACSMLLSFVYVFMPNVSAYFGGLSAFRSSRSSTNNCKNSGISCRNRNRAQKSFYSPITSSTSLSALPTLLADPMPNSIGNFFENKTDDMSFIQCYMLSVAVVDGNQYGKWNYQIRNINVKISSIFATDAAIALSWARCRIFYIVVFCLHWWIHRLHCTVELMKLVQWDQM